LTAPSPSKPVRKAKGEAAAAKAPRKSSKRS
jgi:hypothetical protein